jgi:transposase
MEVPTIMRALEKEVVDTVWAAVEALVPFHPDGHPLGCHRPRAMDRDCFEVMLVRLVTGCSWQDAEALCKYKVSDTTVRARRDEWEAAGLFDSLVDEAIAAYDKIIGLDLSDVSVDGSRHKSPAGGEGTGKSPTDQARLGWKWSMLTEKNGIPLGWVTDGANRHDSVLLEPTLSAVEERGLIEDIETIWLDRAYDSWLTRDCLGYFGIEDAMIAKKRKAGTGGPKIPSPMGLRWPIERTNSWLANFGQLRRNTDRRPHHRLAQFALAVTFLLTVKLIDWRNRWSPGCVPIR